MSRGSTSTPTTPPAPGPGAFFVVEGAGFATGRPNRVRVQALDRTERWLVVGSDRPIELMTAEFRSAGRCSRAGDTGPLEHVVAGLALAGLPGWILEAEHPDLPLLDGSASVWFDSARSLARSGARVRTEPVARDVETLRSERGGSLSGRVAGEFHLEVAWTRGPEGPEVWRGGLEEIAQVVAARTFIDLDVYLAIRAQGGLAGADVRSGRLLRGAAPLDEAAIAFARELGVDPEARVWTGGPPRMEAECAAHKALDLVGDILLWLGYLPCMDVVACDAGHALHHRFGARLRQDLT